MLRQLLIACLLIVSASAIADTMGNEFRVLFTRNFELNSRNCNLSITVVNPNDAAVNVALNYYGTLFDYKSMQYEMITVPAGGMVKQLFPQFDAWEYMNGGFQQQFDTRIVVTTSLPVTLYASNYLTQDGYAVGDTYLVLPYTMAGTSYSFTLPSPAPRTNDVIEYAIAYIIPTRKDVTVQMNVGQWSEKRLIPFKVGSPVHYFAVPYTKNMKDPTFYITGDNDFLVVAAVSCIPSPIGNFDYAAFMPSPAVAPGKCFTDTPTPDNHPTDLVNARRFSFAAVKEGCDNSVDFYDDTRTQVTHPDGTIVKVDNLFGDRAIIKVIDMPSQPIRIGSTELGGTFLAGVPSTAQFVSGTTYFMSETNMMTLYIITDAVASLTMRLDGEVVAFSPEILKIDGVQYHFTTQVVFSTTVPSVHKLDASPGKYIFYLIGTVDNGHSALGYYSAYN
ncbi:hypothetical protein PFISCL1PPCAC_25036, partial [Pristionchus fissidentatus]